MKKYKLRYWSIYEIDIKLINELKEKTFNIIYDKIHYHDRKYLWNILQTNKWIANNTHFRTVGCYMKIEDLYNLHISIFYGIKLFYKDLLEIYTYNINENKILIDELNNCKKEIEILKNQNKLCNEKINELIDVNKIFKEQMNELINNSKSIDEIEDIDK